MRARSGWSLPWPPLLWSREGAAKAEISSIAGQAGAAFRDDRGVGRYVNAVSVDAILCCEDLFKPQAALLGQGQKLLLGHGCVAR